MDVLFEHSLPFFRTSTEQSSSSTGGDTDVTAPNYIGAVIFWSYIGAALYFLWDVLRTLVALHKFATYRKYAYSRVGVYFFSACALVSFASLSYHMLHVLVRSYLLWSRAMGLLIPASAVDAIMSMLPLGQQHASGLSRLWTWSVSNTLFHDFAHEITSSATSWTWAQADLGATLVTAYWMGIRGRRGEASSDVAAAVTPVPKLWTFFALLQILPASLTQSLFMVALLLSPPPPKRHIESGAGAVQPVVLLGKPGYWITCGLLYCFLLVEATQPERRSWLMLMILLARLLLWAPLVLPFMRLAINGDDDDGDQALTNSALGAAVKGEDKTEKSQGTAQEKSESTENSARTANQIVDKASPMQLVDMPLALLALSAWAVVHQGYWAVNDEKAGGIDALLRALHHHPAVSALGFDFIIAAFNFIAWQAFGKPLARG